MTPQPKIAEVTWPRPFAVARSRRGDLFTAACVTIQIALGADDVAALVHAHLAWWNVVNLAITTAAAAVIIGMRVRHHHRFVLPARVANLAASQTWPQAVVPAYSAASEMTVDEARETLAWLATHHVLGAADDAPPFAAALCRAVEDSRAHQNSWGLRVPLPTGWEATEAAAARLVGKHIGLSDEDDTTVPQRSLIIASTLADPGRRWWGKRRPPRPEAEVLVVAVD